MSMKKKTRSLLKDSRYQLLPPSIGTTKRIQRLVDELNNPTGDLSVERIYKDVAIFKAIISILLKFCFYFDQSNLHASDT